MYNSFYDFIPQSFSHTQTRLDLTYFRDTIRKRQKKLLGDMVRTADFQDRETMEKHYELRKEIEEINQICELVNYDISGITKDELDPRPPKAS